jgi:hypothetical protein
MSHRSNTPSKGQQGCASLGRRVWVVESLDEPEIRPTVLYCQTLPGTSHRPQNHLGLKRANWHTKAIVSRGSTVRGHNPTGSTMSAVEPDMGGGSDTAQSGSGSSQPSSPSRPQKAIVVQNKRHMILQDEHLCRQGLICEI